MGVKSMNERVVEILVYIMSELRNRRKGFDKVEALSDDLIKRGYTESEINAAFSWLFERIESESERVFTEPVTQLRNSFRILHDIEKVVITPKAYGYVLQLRELGLIDQADMEQIIERAMMLGLTTVDESDIKAIAASILFGSDPIQTSILGKFMIDKNSVVH